MVYNFDFVCPRFYLSCILSKLNSNLYFMIKKEAIEIKMKRIECNHHGKSIRYKCEHPSCGSPYLCDSFECIGEHFHHDERVILSRFNQQLWESKFQEVQNIINNDILKVKEEELTKIVTYFTKSLSKIHTEMHKFHTIKSALSNNESESLKVQQLDEINGFLSMGNKLDRQLDKLRSKINDDQLSLVSSQEVAEEVEVAEQAPINEERSNSKNVEESIIGAQIDSKNGRQIQTSNHAAKEVSNMHEVANFNAQNEEEENEEILKLKMKSHSPYYQNYHLTHFLEKHIEGFAWNNCLTLFSLQHPLTTCQKFHQKLKDKRDLLFLFIGDNDIIGSYYPEPYPSIQERFRKDNSSFIFIEDVGIEDKFALFQADSQSESHIAVSEKLLICQGNTPNNGDGLRTFQRNFESLAYFLPSRSFHDRDATREVTYNGVLKIKELYIIKMRRRVI